MLIAITRDIERRRSVGSRSDDSVIGRLSDPTSPSAREQGYTRISDLSIKFKCLLLIDVYV